MVEAWPFPVQAKLRAMAIYCQSRKPVRDPCNLRLVALVAGSGVAVADAILVVQKNAAVAHATRVAPRNADVVPATLALRRRVVVDVILAARKSVRATLATPVQLKTPAAAAIRATPVPAVAADSSRLSA